LLFPFFYITFALIAFVRSFAHSLLFAQIKARPYKSMYKRAGLHRCHQIGTFSQK